jgi:exodeoxyribonuclease VII small subunit
MTDKDVILMTDAGEDTGREKDFEAALIRLKDVTMTLEGGDLTLEESMRLFEEGMRLAAQCSKRLDEAEQRVEALVAGKEGERTEPFAPMEEP